MRRPRLPRPRLPKPKLPRPKLPRPNISRPKLPDDLGFRISTRIRAVGYWLREKWQALARRAEVVSSKVGDVWYAQPAALRRGVIGALGVVAVLALVRFAPIPGIPCQISAARECAPSDEVVAVVPADALVYAHATLNSDTAQFERAEKIAEEVPGIPQLLGALLNTLATPSGAEIDFREQIEPWAGDDAAFAIVPGAKGARPSAFMVSADDREGAEEFLGSIAPAAPQEQKQGEATLQVYAGGFASAFVEDFLVFGDDPAVRALIDTAAGKRPSLETGAPGTLRDQMPENRVADVYLSGDGARAILATATPGATQLDTFISFPNTTGVTAATIAREDGVEIELRSQLDPKKAKASPPFFTGLPRFEPGLTDEVGARALGYIGVGEVGPSLIQLVEQGEGAGGQLSTALREFGTRLQGEAGVDPFKDLLPALSGQAAVAVEPTDGVPFASLIVDDVDEQRAQGALARLQQPVLRSVQTPEGTSPPAFSEQEVEGVQVRSLQVSPTINLSYAIFDGKLVLSTDPAGIAQVRAGEQPLADSKTFQRTTSDLPGELSALVFLNLDELLSLAEQAGLAEDPLYASFRDDITKLQSLGLAVSGDEESISSELFLAIE